MSARIEIISPEHAIIGAQSYKTALLRAESAYPDGFYAIASSPKATHWTAIEGTDGELWQKLVVDAQETRRQQVNAANRKYRRRIYPPVVKIEEK